MSLHRLDHGPVGGTDTVPNQKGPPLPRWVIGFGPPCALLLSFILRCVLSRCILGGFTPEGIYPGHRGKPRSSRILGWAQVRLACGGPAGSYTVTGNSEVTTHRDMQCAAQRMLFQKVFFSFLFFKENNVKNLFSNPGYFVKNVDPPPRNSYESP